MIGENTSQERIEYMKHCFLTALDPSERRTMYSLFFFKPDYEQWEIDGALVSIGCNARTLIFNDGHKGREDAK